MYLGVVISDTGSISNDIKHFIDSKRANITIKYNNFLRKNFLAPLSIKLQVLDTCLASSLLYGCETWGKSSVNSLEIAYRIGLKRSLSIRETINNEIVYTESNRLPLKIRIMKKQLKFWLKIQSYLSSNPDHPLNDLIEQGRILNLDYIQYYDNLKTNYETPLNCENVLSAEFRAAYRTKISAKAHNDPESRLGTYLRINPQLKAPTLCKNQLEFERVLLTRYRCGSHNLKIETGRLNSPKIPRENRICSCNSGIQSLHHCFFECPLLRELLQGTEFTSLEEAINLPNIINLLLNIEKTLKI